MSLFISPDNKPFRVLFQKDPGGDSSKDVWFEIRDIPSDIEQNIIEKHTTYVMVEPEDGGKSIKEKRIDHEAVDLERADYIFQGWSPNVINQDTGKFLELTPENKRAVLRDRLISLFIAGALVKGRLVREKEKEEADENLSQSPGGGSSKGKNPARAGRNRKRSH